MTCAKSLTGWVSSGSAASWAETVRLNADTASNRTSATATASDRLTTDDTLTTDERLVTCDLRLAASTTPVGELHQALDGVQIARKDPNGVRRGDLVDAGEPDHVAHARVGGVQRALDVTPDRGGIICRDALQAVDPVEGAG